MVSTSTRASATPLGRRSAGWPRCRPCPASARPSAPRRAAARRQRDRLGAVAGLADHLDVGLRLEQHREARRAPAPGRRRPRPGSHAVVLRQGRQRADPEAAAGRARRRARRRAAATRSRMPTRPCPPPGRRRPGRTAAGRCRRPRSAARPCRSATVTSTLRRAGVLEDVGQRLLHDPVGGQVDAGASVRRRPSTIERRRARPAARTSSTRRSGRRGRARARRRAARRLVAEHAEQAAHLGQACATGRRIASRALRAPASGRSSSDVRAAAGLHGDHAHLWATTSCSSRAIRRRSRSRRRAGSLVARSRHAPRTRGPGQLDWRGGSGPRSRARPSGGELGDDPEDVDRIEPHRAGGTERDDHRLGGDEPDDGGAQRAPRARRST